MLEDLMRIDKEFFEWSIIYFNQSWVTSMGAFLGEAKYFIGLFFLFILVYSFFKTKEAFLFLFLILILALISELSISLLKKEVGRLRPGVLMGLYMNPKAYSFPSAHSWNSMALFSFSGFWFSNRFILSFGIFFSLLIGIGRFLDNNHFFLDVLAGWAGGICLGYAYWKTVKLIRKFRQ